MTEDAGSALARLAGKTYCYLTTTGRVTGRPHTIEIWFASHGSTLYMLSGGGDRSDWVKNLRKRPEVTVRIDGQTFAGSARIVGEEWEHVLARHALATKYQSWSEGQPLSDWGRTALPVAIDVTS
ncbi:MAG TPA: nitroreductase family deazaflavin-dependent oxidoreductase [Ktedonobacterales bacterium]